MVILHAFLALTAGFSVLAVLALSQAALVARLVPSWASNQRSPSPSYVFVSLGFAAISAAAGGYVTAWAATDNPLIHSLALGIIVLGLSALSALQAQGKQPIWYQLAQVAVSPLAVLAGGLIRLRILGIL